MKKLLSVLASLLLVASFATASFADATANMNVTTSISTQATLSVGNLNFGAYDPSSTMPLMASANISVTATAGAGYEITIGPGWNFNFGPIAGFRAMINSTVVPPSFLSYDLICSPANGGIPGGGWWPNGMPWGDTPGFTTFGVGTGAPQNGVVDGYLPPQGLAAAGSYSDVVVVTVIL